MRALVLGAGPVGRHVAEELHQRGHEVTIVSRSGSLAARGAITAVAADVTDEGDRSRWSGDVDVIVHALNPAYHRWAQDFPRLQGGALALAERTGARLVVMDNVYAYGRSHGRPLTEESPEHPHTRKGEVRRQLNAALWRAHRQRRVSVTVGRASDYFGVHAGDATVLGEAVRTSILRGDRAWLFGNPDTVHSFSWLPDIARGLAYLAEEPSTAGRVWHLPTSPHPTTTRELVERAFHIAGHEPRIGRVPMIAVRAAGLVSPLFRELVEMEYEFAEDFVVSGERIAAAGVRPTSLDEALRAWVGADEPGLPSAGGSRPGGAAVHHEGRTRRGADPRA